MKYLFLAAFIQALWGFTPTASRLALDVLPVDVFIALRFTIAAAIFFSIAACRREWQRLSFKLWGQLAGIGILTFGLASFLTLHALKTGGVVNFALASAISPLLVGLLARLVLKEKLSNWFLRSLPLYALGILFLAYGKGLLDGFHIATTSLISIAAAYLCDAIGFVSSKKVRETIPLMQYLAILQFFGAAFAWIFVLQEGQPLPFSGIDTAHWLAVAFVSVIACCVCYVTWYWLLNFVEAHRLGFFEAFHVLSASFFGYVFFQEPLNVWMVLGGILLLLSVYLINKSAHRLPVESGVVSLH